MARNGRAGTALLMTTDASFFGVTLGIPGSVIMTLILVMLLWSMVSLMRKLVTAR